MPKWAKTIVAILLLPFCFGALKTLWRLLNHPSIFTVQHSLEPHTMWVALASGAACWWVVYLLLPKPMRLYVFGHELTHALWTWAFGGRVKRFKIGSSGGHVVVTKHNFLIALAPYFFPLYAALVVGCFAVGHLLWNWSAHLVWFHFFIGAAYAFHITLTWHILQSRQSDITGQGYLFSFVVIFLGNIILLLFAIPLLTRSVPFSHMLSWWLTDSLTPWRQIFTLF